MAKKVTVINAISDSKHTQPQQRLKVCAYARVSTGSRAQAESYATQVEYYTEKIENNPLWEFAGVYADEGITGTKVKGRDDFKAMVAACEEGDIDLILTKSITRFARNTVECIQTIRKLKAIGVGIYFEKEGINTLTEASELMLTILASVAQGESEDFSGNNRWAIINRFENGTFIVGTPAYGYGSSSIIRKQLLWGIAILLQATAYRTFHTLFSLSFLIDCLFLLQNRCCNHMLLHSQQHLYHDLIHLQNSVKLLFHSYCISQ